MVNQLFNSHRSSKERFTEMHIHVLLPRHQYSPFSAFLLSTGYSASRVFVFLVHSLYDARNCSFDYISLPQMLHFTLPSSTCTSMIISSGGCRNLRFLKTIAEFFSSLIKVSGGGGGGGGVPGHFYYFYLSCSRDAALPSTVNCLHLLHLSTFPSLPCTAHFRQ